MSTLRAEVAGVLDRLPPDADPREAFAALGRERLFAVHYPRELGGRGGSLLDYAVVAEEIGDRGLADEVHLITVQGVGCAVWQFGTPEQHRRWLLGLAAGTTPASLLLSETGAGSDASAITTSARHTADGWSLTGEKTWSLHADWSGFGLCSARTAQVRSKYAGITLFLVDLAAPGVTVRPRPRLLGKPYFTVTFDDVRLSDADVLGTPGGGFRLLTAAAGFERAGLDYLSRGWMWLRAADDVLRQMPGLADNHLLGELARAEAELRGARALAWSALGSAEGLEIDYVRSAYAKYLCGEAAQSVARVIGEELLPDPRVAARPDLVKRLRSAVLEGPELSISGNAVDLLLDTISLDPELGEL